MSEVIIRESTEKDIQYFNERLRVCDIEEMWAASRTTPAVALETCFKCPVCKTVEYDSPVAIFGCGQPDEMLKTARIWMLATDDLEKIKKTFVERSMEQIEVMLEMVPLLYNYVDCRNRLSIKWLKWLGANMSDPLIYGSEMIPFVKFFFMRKN